MGQSISPVELQIANLKAKFVRLRCMYGGLSGTVPFLP